MLYQLTTFVPWKCVDSLPPPGDLVSQTHPHTDLCSIGAVWARRSVPHVVALSVGGAHICPGCFRQQPYIQPAAFQCPDGLCQYAALTTLDGECPNGGPGWVQGPVARRQKRLVKVYGTWRGCPGECGWHRCRVKNGGKNKENPRTGYCRI